MNNILMDGHVHEVTVVKVDDYYHMWASYLGTTRSWLHRSKDTIESITGHTVVDPDSKWGGPCQLVPKVTPPPPPLVRYLRDNYWFDSEYPTRHERVVRVTFGPEAVDAMARRLFEAIAALATDTTFDIQEVAMIAAEEVGCNVTIGEKA